MRKNFVFMRHLLLPTVLFWIFLGGGMPANAKEPGFTSTLKGSVIDYAWAHATHKLAILFQDQELRAALYVFDADKQKYIAKIPIPAKYHPKCVAWRRDDAGFLLAMSPADVDDDSALIDAFYRYVLTEKRFAPAYQDLSNYK